MADILAMELVSAQFGPVGYGRYDSFDCQEYSGLLSLEIFLMISHRGKMLIMRNKKNNNNKSIDDHRHIFFLSSHVTECIPTRFSIATNNSGPMYRYTAYEIRFDSSHIILLL